MRRQRFEATVGSARDCIVIFFLKRDTPRVRRTGNMMPGAQAGSVGNAGFVCGNVAAGAGFYVCFAFFGGCFFAGMMRGSFLRRNMMFAALCRGMRAAVRVRAKAEIEDKC